MISSILLAAAMNKPNLARQPIDSARWIVAPFEGPMPLFRHAFTLGKSVRRATVQVCGLGAFELRVNGKKIGDHFMDPGWTNYRKTCLYVEFDVSRRLRQGENALGVMLGNGFFNVAGGRYTKYTGSFGKPRLKLALAIAYQDGTSDTVTTEPRWRCQEGPITFSCVYGGEDFDAGREPAGWDKPGYDDSDWHRAAEEPPLGEVMAKQEAPPMKVMETFAPVRMAESKPGVWVYDLGQNASGIPSIKVKGKRGVTVKITPAELLDKAGLADQTSSGGPVWFAYTLRGGRTEQWQPRFTYYGFRYLQIEGAVPAGKPNPNGLPVLAEVKELHTRAASATVGSFECSSELFNQIHTLVNWAVKSNMQSVFTDCPHREKLGWLEQTHLMGPSIMYDYDVATMWRKVSRDMVEAQLDDGLVPDIAPEYVVFKGGFRDSPEWGSACILVPWQAYRWYGDLQILRDAYPMMRRYVEYLGTKAADGILSHGLGDWYDFGPNGPGYSQLTPISFTATAFFCHNLSVLDRVAQLVGAKERFASRAAAANEAFNRRFFHSDTNQYADGSQCANAMALAMDLAPKDRREAVLANLVNDVRAHGNHLTAGDVGYTFLLRALAEGGRSDVIWDMAVQKTAPSYADQLAKGATALTEAWDAGRSSSQNHFMLGHIEEWFYHDLAGIGQAPDGAGYGQIVIRPQVVGNLTWVKASYRSVRGSIAVEWRIARGTLTLDVQVPRGAAASVYVPNTDPTHVTADPRANDQGAGVFKVRGGKWRFTAPWKF